MNSGVCDLSCRACELSAVLINASVVGPVVIPVPLPARALLLVTVEAVAAIGTCPVVMPLSPLLPPGGTVKFPVPSR